MSDDRERPDFTQSVYHVESSDPESVLVDRSSMSAEDVAQINRLMGALGALRKAEERLSEASTTYMKLNKTDMRALHYLIVSQNRGELATPGAIAAHLGISTASTTKLLDRLARGGHIYLCGNKSRTEGAVREAVGAIGGEGHWDALRGEGRTHCELY